MRRLERIRLTLALVIVSFLWPVHPRLAASAQPDSARQAQLENLLTQDCGSCHGITLNGGLGTPLTPQALAGKTVRYLTTVIQNGIPGTPMPSWSGVLTEAEILWMSKRLLRPGGEL